MKKQLIEGMKESWKKTSMFLKMFYVLFVLGMFGTMATLFIKLPFVVEFVIQAWTFTAMYVSGIVLMGILLRGIFTTPFKFVEIFGILFTTTFIGLGVWLVGVTLLSAFLFPLTDIKVEQVVNLAIYSTVLGVLVCTFIPWKKTSKTTDQI